MLFIPLESQQHGSIDQSQLGQDAYFSLDAFEVQQERIIADLLTEFYSRLDGDEGRRVAERALQSHTPTPIDGAPPTHAGPSSELSAETFVFNPYRPPKGAKYKEVLTQLNIREWAKARHVGFPSGSQPEFLHLESVGEHTKGTLRRNGVQSGIDISATRAEGPEDSVDEQMVEAIYQQLLKDVKVVDETLQTKATESNPVVPTYDHQPTEDAPQSSSFVKSSKKQGPTSLPSIHLHPLAPLSIDPLKMLISSHQFGGNYRFGAQGDPSAEADRSNDGITLDAGSALIAPTWKDRNELQAQGLGLDGVRGGRRRAIKTSSNKQVEVNNVLSAESPLNLKGVRVVGAPSRSKQIVASPPISDGAERYTRRKVSFEKRVAQVVFARAMATHDPAKVSELLGGNEGIAPTSSPQKKKTISEISSSQRKSKHLTSTLDMDLGLVGMSNNHHGHKTAPHHQKDSKSIDLPPKNHPARINHHQGHGKPKGIQQQHTALSDGRGVVVESDSASSNKELVPTLPPIIGAPAVFTKIIGSTLRSMDSPRVKTNFIAQQNLPHTTHASSGKSVSYSAPTTEARDNLVASTARGPSSKVKKGSSTLKTPTGRPSTMPTSSSSTTTLPPIIAPARRKPKM